MIEIDGSQGEGGGQVLRTALALSCVTLKPFRIHDIRARRPKPGLMRQHLASVHAAATISLARVSGDTLGSRELELEPKRITPGNHTFSIGSAGSTTLVFQTVLPALLRADAPSELVLEGGTHNPLAPTFDFLERAYLPLVARMGPRVELSLDRHGFYPRGGGRFRARIQPGALSRIDLLERGALKSLGVKATVASLPHTIAEREIAKLRKRLDQPAAFETQVLEERFGPGNVVTVTLEHENVTEVVTAIGEKGIRAEAVADAAGNEALAYLASGVPVGQHLADQLVLLLALAGGGSFHTLEPTGHLVTQMDVVKEFLDVLVSADRVSERVWLVQVKPDN